MHERVPEVVKAFDALMCQWAIPILATFVAVLGVSVAALWWLYTGPGHIPDFSRPHAPVRLAELFQLCVYLCAGLASLWSLLSLVAFVSLWKDGDWAIWDVDGKLLKPKA